MSPVLLLFNANSKDLTKSSASSCISTSLSLITLNNIFLSKSWSGKISEAKKLITSSIIKNFLKLLFPSISINLDKAFGITIIAFKTLFLFFLFNLITNALPWLTINGNGWAGSIADGVSKG